MIFTVPLFSVRLTFLRFFDTLALLHENDKSEVVMAGIMEWFNVFGLIFYCSHYDTQCCICD